jgi:tripartite ATP-independent transporter DctP family solute receptor
MLPIPESGRDMTRRAISTCVLGLFIGMPLAVGALVPAAGTAPADEGSKISLELAHVLPASHSVHASLQFMAARLSDLSHGAVELQVRGGAQLGSEPESIEQAKRGTLAATKVSAAALEPFVPDMAVFGMPYLFRDEEHCWNVLLGEIGREILLAAERSGLHGVAYYDSGSRSFYTLSKPIEKPTDLRGLTVRVQPSRQAEQMVSVLGGSPTALAYGDVLAALQQGKIQGAENNPPSFYTSRHYEVAKHLSLDEHTRVPDVILFSKKIWDGFSPQVRAWIEQAATESVAFQRKLWRDQTEEALREVQKAGVTIYHPDQSAFAAAMGPMYTKADGTRLGELARRILVAE